MSAQELRKILGTPEFNAFVAGEYELKDPGVKEIIQL